jgi:hypothetical protein
MNIEVNEDELKLIVHALHAVTPMGGGSTQLHLAGRLGEDMDVDDDLLERLCMATVTDYFESMYGNTPKYIYELVKKLRNDLAEVDIV